MSVLSEINRIKQGVLDSILAVNQKGVTVPENTKINELSQYILNIDTPIPISNQQIDQIFQN